MSADNTARIAILLDASQSGPVARATAAELNGIGAAGKAAGVSATAGLTQLEQRIGGLSSAILANRAAIADANVAIASGRQVTAQLSAELKILTDDGRKGSAAAAELALQIEELNASEKRLTLTKQQLIAETQVLTTEQALLKAELATTNVVTDETSAKQIGLSQAIRVGAAEMRVLGIAGSNMGRAFSVLAGGFSAATLGMFAIILAAGFLIGKLIESFKAKETNINLDERQIGIDNVRLEQLRQLAEANHKTNDALNEQWGAQMRLSETNLNALLGSYILHSREYAEATAKVADEEHKLAEVIATGSAGFELHINSWRTSTQVLHDHGVSLAQAKEEQQKAGKAREDDTKGLRTFQDTMKDGNNIITDHIGRLNADADALHFLQGELDFSTKVMRDFNAEMDKLKTPKFDFSQTPAGIQAQVEGLAKGMKGIAPGTDAGKAAGITNLRQEVEALRPSFRALSEDAKKTGEAINDPDVKQGVELYRQLYDHHKSGAGAARAHALAENSLTRELKDAQAALIGDSFAARDQKITNDVAAEREALRIKKELNTLAVTQLVDLEKAKHQKVAQDRKLAEQRLMDELQVMQITGMAYETQREQATLALRLRQRSEEVHKEFGFTVEAEELITAFKKANAEAFHRWLDDKEKARRTEWLHAESQLWQTVADERLAIDKKVIAAGMKLLIDQNKKIGELNRQFGANRLDLGGFGGQFEQARLLALDARMKALGVDVRGVNQIFGATTRTVEQLEARLGKMEEVGIDGLDALQEKIRFTQQVFQALGGAIQAGFAAMVSGSQSFGDAMLASFLGAVAQMAAAYGALYISMGIANLFTPGMHAIGAVQLAQGLALEALAGVLGGAASLLGSSKASGAAAGTSSASTAATEAPRQGVSPRIIPFPTSGPSMVTLRLDRNLSNDLIKGNDVVVMADFHGTGSNTPALRKRISKWSKSPYAS